MAVDTRQKRHSLIGYGLAYRLTLPVSDGALGQGDRQHLVGLYSGILATSPPTVDLHPASTFQARRRGTTYERDTTGTTFQSAHRGARFDRLNPTGTAFISPRRGTTFTPEDSRP